MAKINYLRNTGEHVTYQASEVIYSAGDTAETLFVVQAGVVELQGEDGYRECIHEGEYFGEIELIEKAPRAYTAVAKSDCVVTAVDHRYFLYLVHETPTFALDIMRQLTGRIRRMSA